MDYKDKIRKLLALDQQLRVKFVFQPAILLSLENGTVSPVF